MALERFSPATCTLFSDPARLGDDSIDIGAAELAFAPLLEDPLRMLAWLPEPARTSA